jgi:UDP-GlcNAc:undecaprenyl-phosphate GlcNAc-1-phosphate transferase
MFLGIRPIGETMTGFYALVFAGALAMTAAMIWGLCRLAPRLGLIDHPQGRKAHARATPVVGGLAIFASATVIAVALMIVQSKPTAPLGAFQEHIGFAIGLGLLFLMGAVDDWRPIPARYKLLGQLVSCLIAVVGSGAVVGDIGIKFAGHALSLGHLVWPFSVLVMLTVTNAINMIDGVDGLAGGVTLVALAVMAKALITAGFTSAPYAVALIGALTAFLLFNFPVLKNQKAKLFLGDSGSLMFGFTVAYMAIQLSGLPGRVFRPSTALWFFFIPVADTIWIYIRRMWVARAPFAAGRDHIHHLLMARFSPRLVTWIIVIASAILAGGAYLAERKGVDNSVLILSWIGAFCLYGALTQKAWMRAWHASRAQDGAPVATLSERG